MFIERVTRGEFLKRVALAAVSSAGLAACGGPAAAPATTVPPAITTPVAAVKTSAVAAVAPTSVPAQGIATIRYHARAGASEEVLYKDRISQFNSENPQYKAVLEAFPGGDQEYGPKILSLFAAGTLGDAMWTSCGSVLNYFFAAKGITAPLDDLIAAQKVDLAQWFPGTVDVLKYKGKLYGLPLKSHPDAAFFFYNKTMFDKEGVPVPTATWTLDDLVEKAKALTKQSGGKTTQWGVQVGTTWYAPNIIARAFGSDMMSADGTKATVNDPKTIQALTWYRDLFQKHKVAPTAQAMSGTNEINLMASGQLAMFQSGPWGASQLSSVIKKGGQTGGAFEWWLVTYPLGPAKVSPSMSGVDDVAVASASKQKEGAFKLSQYFTDKEAGVQLCLGDTVCGARPDLADDKRINDNLFTQDDTAYFKIVRDATAKAMPFVYPANLRGIEAHQHNSQGLDPLWLGTEQPTPAFFDKLNKGLQDLLDKPVA